MGGSMGKKGEGKGRERKERGRDGWEEGGKLEQVRRLDKAGTDPRSSTISIILSSHVT